MEVKTDHDQYTIAQRSSRKFPIEEHAGLCKFTIVFAWSIWLLSFVGEVYLVLLLPHDSRAQIGRKCIVAILAEFLLSFQDMILAFGLLVGLCSPARRAPRPSYELIGESAPAVDVLITCCGEAVDIILDTVKAAASQDYPSEKLRILVLDDGHDDELRLQVEWLKPWLDQSGLGRVKYLSRDIKRGTKSFFKAGNLNFGIFNGTSEAPAEYVAGLDCDMFPEPKWLRQSIGHLVLDDTIGMTVAPQVSRPLPSMCISS